MKLFIDSCANTHIHYVVHKHVCMSVCGVVRLERSLWISGSKPTIFDVQLLDCGSDLSDHAFRMFMETIPNIDLNVVKDTS